MFDKNKLHDELTDAFINYQWNLDKPFPDASIKHKEKIMEYRMNPIFRNKVQQLVVGVMRIVEKNINEDMNAKA